MKRPRSRSSGGAGSTSNSITRAGLPPTVTTSGITPRLAPAVPHPIAVGSCQGEPPLLAFLLSKYLRRQAEGCVHGNAAPGGGAPLSVSSLSSASTAAAETNDNSAEPQQKVVYEVDGSADCSSSSTRCSSPVSATRSDPPLEASVSSASGNEEASGTTRLPAIAELLPYPLGSLEDLGKYLYLHCTRLAAKRPLVQERYLLDTPPTTAVILRAIGYLSSAPLLRCVLMHHALATKQYAQVLACMDTLRRDVGKLWMRLESQLRESMFDVTSSRLTSSAITKNAIFVTAFTIALRYETNLNVERLKTHGPRPALLIVPSQIRVANFGVFIRGSIAADTPIMGYAGEQEEEDAYASGYRMEGDRGTVIDSLTERCLCSMMNDSRFSVFSNNCTFKKSGTAGVRAFSKRTITDEELFVSYGAKFRFDLEGVAAGFSRSLAADMSWLARGVTLPQLNAAHGAVSTT